MTLSINDFLNEDQPTPAADVMLNVAPLTHAARGPLRKHYVKGARNIILQDFNAAEVLATIQQERVTTTMLVPTMLIRVLLHPQVHTYDLRSLQRVFFGTAPMPPNKLQEAIEIFGNIFWQNHGLSEATQPVLCLSPQALAVAEAGTPRRRLASAGRPALGIEVRLVNDTGADVARNEDGELLIRGEVVMPGYWQDPEATDEVLDAAGWLHTGDVVRQDEDGFVSIVGRKKDMIISGGFNIYPRTASRAAQRGRGALRESAWRYRMLRPASTPRPALRH